jgi:gluconolactonase
MKEIIDDRTAPKKPQSRFLFTEGPVWLDAENCWLFSDIAGNTIYRLDDSDRLSVFRRPSQMANGNTLDIEGRLLTCEHATSRVTRTEADGEITVLASHYQDMQLNSPNDLVVDRSGNIYFTDPQYGRMEFYGVKRTSQLPFRGVYRIPAQGGLPQLLVKDFDQPNGLCLSLDGSLLFVNDTRRYHIRIFKIDALGSLSGGAVWAETKGNAPGTPDGMKIDVKGNLYCCGPGGVHVFDPEANCLGVIVCPEEVANFTWGGRDRLMLLMTAQTSVYQIPVKIPGLGTVRDYLSITAENVDVNGDL